VCVSVCVCVGMFIARVLRLDTVLYTGSQAKVDWTAELS